ncbi:hypothetical protein L7F22_055485 [Adiantum nelumboides]|nr:hypothetical protein [Adiantum nelumboides]
MSEQTNREGSRDAQQEGVPPAMIPSAPWESIAMDFIFGLPKTSSGNEGIWMIVDRFSKQAHFIPVRKQITAEQMAKTFLVTMFKYYGMPRSITDDQSEIVNCAVLDLLKCYVSDNPAQWEHFLLLVEFSYNNTIHSSTGKAPFEIVGGARKLPPMVKGIQKAQEKQKKAADKHRRRLRFREGDWVLLRFEEARLRKQKGKEKFYPKLRMRYYGPFQISEVINDVSYRLFLHASWKIHNAFDVSLLRQFVGELPDQPEDSPQPEVDKLDEVLQPEQFLAHKERRQGGRMVRRYLVKFKNYSAMDSKWMEEADLADTPQILELYLEAFSLQPTIPGAQTGIRARANFITPELAEKMGIKTDEMGPSYTASMAPPGHEVAVMPYIGKLRVHIQGYVGHEEFFIMPLEGCDVQLGFNMACKTNPTWSLYTNVLSIITTTSQQGFGTRLWQCKYCRDQYTSTITRVKKHLTGIGCTDQIGACDKIPPPLKEQLIAEYFPVGAPGLRGAASTHDAFVGELETFGAETEAPARNHPLLLLSGFGTNAIGFDLDPSVSFARHLAEQGFDTWILEVRGAGLSKIEGQPTSSEIGKAVNGSLSGNVKSMVNDMGKSQGSDAVENAEQQASVRDDFKVATSPFTVFTQIIEKSKRFVDEGQSLLMSASLLDKISNLLDNFQLADRYEEFRERLNKFLEERQNSTVTKQFVNLSNKLLKLLEDSQQAVSPQLSDLQDRLLNASQIADLQERLISTIDDFQKLLDLVVTYDWDFDQYLEEDIPVVMDYIRQQSKPKDGKMHAVGHSMGGILLYALIASQKENCSLASVVTLASSVDYTVSNSSLKLLVPLADPAQLLNVPAVPLGALMTALHPLTVNSPTALAWLSAQVSAQEMMEPELFKKLVLNNFCTIPAKLLLQLMTAFQPRGLRNRTGTFFFKDHLSTAMVPVLAVAGDLDLICPPSAVLDTAKALPENLVEYKLFGGKNNTHYGHYDLVCGRAARKEIFPYVTDFLVRHDGVPEMRGDEHL